MWQDRRTTDFCRARAADQPALAAKTGLVLDPYFSGTKLRWLLDAQPLLRVRADRGEVLFGTVDSFLAWRLTGGARHVTDSTNASRTLLFNIHALQWDDELLRYFGVPRAALPEVLPSAAQFGVTKGLDFLPDGVPICGVAGDQQAALYGQHCFTAGASKCTYGTGAFYLLHTGSTAVASEHKLLTTVAATTGGTPQYALEGAVFVAGAAVQWLRDQLGVIRTAAESAGIAASVHDTAGVYYPAGTSGRRLREVGCTVDEHIDGLTVRPPSWRPDLRESADLVEEVLRLEGLEAIPAVVPRAPGGQGLTPVQRRRRHAHLDGDRQRHTGAVRAPELLAEHQRVGGIRALTAVLGRVLQAERPDRSQLGEQVVCREDAGGLPLVAEGVDLGGDEIAHHLAEGLVLGAEVVRCGGQVERHRLGSLLRASQLTRP